MGARVVSGAPRRPSAARPARGRGGSPGRWKIVVGVLAGLVVVAVIGRMAFGMVSPSAATSTAGTAATVETAAPRTVEVVGDVEAPVEVAERVVRAYTMAGVLRAAGGELERVLGADVRADARDRLRTAAAANLRLTDRVAGDWLRAAGRTEPVVLLSTLAARAQRAGEGMVVDGYDVQVAGVEGHRAQGTWRSWRVSLTEQDERWLVTGLRSRRGPAPESTSRAAGPRDSLVAGLRAMQARP